MERLQVEIDTNRFTAAAEATEWGFHMVVRSNGGIVAYRPVSTRPEAAIQYTLEDLTADERYVLALEHAVLNLSEQLAALDAPEGEG